MKRSRFWNLQAWLMLATMTMALPMMAQTVKRVGTEEVTRLHATPRSAPFASLKSTAANEYFIYENDMIDLPVIDDFSVDRTRHLNAQEGDGDVTLTETIYRLELNGLSTPGMAYVNDTSYHYTYDVQDDTLIVTIAPNPALVVIVRDVTSYPVTEESMYLWPPYNVVDTINDLTTDTLALDPTTVQDSMLVFSVAADTRTYINPDNSLRPLILWSDDDAYVNSTFPLNPPTIGVATLDGMDRTGYPYLPDAPNTQGLADHLTSVAIDLAFPASDSIYLSFLCEPVGLSGDMIIHAEDSLRLELYAPDEDLWYQVWSKPQTTITDVFQHVMVPIKEARYLKVGFRMRFSNDATLGGAVDQWHIDYVRLDRNRNHADTVLQDVAYVDQEAGLLQTFTSVPFAKFVESPAAYMAQQVDLVQRNNDTQDKFITWGYGVESDCGWSTTRAGYGSNISANAYTTFNTVHPVNSGGDPLVFDLSGCTDAAVATVKFWTNATPDGCAYNDTMAYAQDISNYYSYDDGTAEAGYSLTNSGMKQAMRFDTQGSDSLRALRMYFDPIFTYDGPINDPTDSRFILTVWSSLTPEVLIHQDISFNSPEYHTWGPDHYVEYPLDSTIAVSGTFYVGWVQTNDTKMYLGLDRNRDNHDKMFWFDGVNWANTNYTGSWMIRPVMVAAVDPYAGIAEDLAPAASLSIYPNPANDLFSVKMGNDAQAVAEVELIDLMGRAVRQWKYDGMPMSLQGVASGVYVVRTIARDGRPLGQGRLIVQ